ncbi:hypothetical protein AXF42_Ash002195 [Apostasia shenzhenica]|uniref:Uncharacterized protein n=1 Tax=Apostasia shenzhenica TaxID=1088818 RepID=A0A2I0AMV6_9ASPA|nr:hypothetical protein AXF42_Ash002195 [Apostasia shenzhenica]
MSYTEYAKIFLFFRAAYKISWMLHLEGDRFFLSCEKKVLHFEQSQCSGVDLSPTSQQVAVSAFSPLIGAEQEAAALFKDDLEIRTGGNRFCLRHGSRRLRSAFFH